MPLLERDVVVCGRRPEVGGLRRRPGRHELVPAAARVVAASAEELDALGDDLDRLALGAVLRLPLAPVEAAVDADRPALREVLRAALRLVAEHGDVEVVRLVAPLAGRIVLLARVDGDPELADGRPVRGRPELGVLRQVPDEDDPVDVGHYSSSSCEPMFAPAYPRSRSLSSRGGGGTSSRGARVWEPSTCFTARCRTTPSVILRMRVISASVSALASKTMRW